MFSYEFYKTVHFFFIILFAATIGFSFASPSPPKWTKILIGLMSLLIFVAGMGLMARVGVSHGGPWPKWLLIKIGLWLVLAILAPVLSKRLGGAPVNSSCRYRAFWVLMILFLFLVVLAVYQPF
ncbi:MAG: SirB2 family protein [Bacteriovoracales bacterium]|nr:SirB2 family protein [Bacteriovoracales bacterium]